MTSPTIALEQINVAIADALVPLADELDRELQVVAFLNTNPTPPSIDVYAGDPFMGPGAFGGWHELFYTVRARVSTADQQAGQQLLYQLLGPGGVEDHLTDDQTLGGMVSSLGIGDEGSPGVSGFRVYPATEAGAGDLVGVEWRVRILQ